MQRRTSMPFQRQAVIAAQWSPYSSHAWIGAIVCMVFTVISIACAPRVPDVWAALTSRIAGHLGAPDDYSARATAEARRATAGARDPWHPGRHLGAGPVDWHRGCRLDLVRSFSTHATTLPESNFADFKEDVATVQAARAVSGLERADVELRLRTGIRGISLVPRTSAGRPAAMTRSPRFATSRRRIELPNKQRAAGR